MRKVYIILAHKNPAQVSRLINRLDDKRSTFFIHIDRSASASRDDFRAAIGSNDRVHYVNSIRTRWGSFALVKATLKAMQQVRKTGVDYDRMILLSGQDYPIKNNAHIDRFFRSAPHSTFMDCHTLPDFKRWPGTGGMYRVNKYYFGPSLIQKFAAKAANFLSAFIPMLRRGYPKNMRPFAGSQWWVMDKEAVDYVLDFVEQQPEYTRFHWHTFAPDELFFQMILKNAKDQRIKQSITSDSVRWMKWPVSSTAHPEILKAHDFTDIANSPALFARKFEETEDGHVLDLIDQHLLNSNNSGNE